jgi:peptide deformylase
LNDKGETQEIKAKGLLARVLQHEIDHLQGKLIIDYFSLGERAHFEMNRKQ